MRTVQRVFPATTVDGEFYLEPCKGFWSIVKPLNREVGNQIVNPSFEQNNFNYWHVDFQFLPNGPNAIRSMSARFTTNQDAAYDGEYALRIDQDIPGLTFGVIYAPLSFGDPAGAEIRVPANGGKIWLSAWVKARRGDFILIRGERDNAVPAAAPGFIIRQDRVVATGEWQRVKVFVTNNQTVDDYAALVVGIEPANNNPLTGAFGLIDAAMAATDDLADYFDGDSEEASWTGIPYQSSSLLSRYARRNGKEVYLNDVGLNIISFAGHGMPPIDNDTIPYGQGGGSYHNRSWPGASRTITIVGQIESRDGLRKIQKIHSRLIELFGLYRMAVDQQDFLLRYRLTRCDCDVTGVLEIPVVYKAGMEGSTNNIASERVTIQFDAYEDLYWRSLRTITRKLAPNAGTEICYEGTAPTPMRVCVEGDTVGANNVDVNSIVNAATGEGIFFQQAAGQSFVSVPAGTRLCFGDIDTLCATATRTVDATGAETDVSNTIQRPASVPSQFILLNGANVITTTVGLPAAGNVPIVHITYRERFLSATDAWRIPRLTECADTFDHRSFRKVC